MRSIVMYSVIIYGNSHFFEERFLKSSVSKMLDLLINTILFLINIMVYVFKFLQLIYSID